MIQNRFCFSLIFFMIFFFFEINSNSFARSAACETEDETYEVKSGDTWFGIAKKFSITYPELKLSNSNIDKLFPGQKLRIPSGKLKSTDPYFEKKKIDTISTREKYHIVKKSETLYSIAKLHKITVQRLKEI